MVDILTDITYESDEDIILPTQNIDYIFKKIIMDYPNHRVWIQYLKQWYQNHENINSELKGWTINIDIKDWLNVEFIFVYCGIVKAHFKWSITDKEPHFPNAPPKMVWLGPRYDWKIIMQLNYLKPFIPSQWNLCQDLNKILIDISHTVIKLTPISENVTLTTLEENIMKFIELTGTYPSDYTGSESLPTFGVINYKTIAGDGTGYSAGVSNESFKIDYSSHDKELSSILKNIENELQPDTLKAIENAGVFHYLEGLVKSTTHQEFETHLNTYVEIYRIYLKNIVPSANEMQFKLYNLWEDVKDSTELSEERGLYIENIITKYDITEYNDIDDDVEKDDDVEEDDDVEMEDADFEKDKSPEMINQNYIQKMSSSQKTIVEKWDSQLHEGNYHHYTSSSGTIVPRWIKRLRREWKDLSTNCSLNGLFGNIYVAWCIDDPSRWKILITPSLTTPYSCGAFIFDMLIPSEYPKVSPKIKLLTTGNGKVRFNPNLYNCGKVCLSLLGTWAGEPWNPEISNLTQLFISILAMIFVDDPYFNEPGYQTTRGTEEGDKKSKEYNKNIKYNTLHYAVYEPICKPKKENVFNDIIHNHFKLVWEKAKDEYHKWIDEETNAVRKEEMKKWICEIKEVLKK